MGAWGAGAFENDDALDWLDELEGADDFAPIFGAIDTVLGLKGDSPEAPEAAMAIAAAEVVAALDGRPHPELPEDVADWVAGKPKPIPRLVERARLAAIAVRDNSELRDLWAEPDADFDEWKGEVDGLVLRLGGTPQAS